MCPCRSVLFGSWECRVYCTVQKQRLREDERWRVVVVVGGLGMLGWINTVDTKGLGGRDLLFSSTLPSISLNPALLVPGLSGKSEVPKSAIINMWWWGWVKIMQGAKKSSYSPLSSAEPGINYCAVNHQNRLFGW